MKRLKITLFTLKRRWALLLYAALDVICVGAGMGVPIFCILLGLPVGWAIATRLTVRPRPVRQALDRVLRWAALTAAFTCVLMTAVWSRMVGMLFDPAADLANFGIPLILYEPAASFIGWLVLMIVISPFLQFLMTLFGAHLALLRRLPPE
ncbi:MAG: hypothetical protein NT169_14145 [Chloroflexi bacterium]|nr:hypothetical protein [Chloroflexota bacterium]